MGVCQVLSGAACAPAELVLDCATEWSRISDMTVNYIIAPHSRLHISPRDWIGLYAVCSAQSLFTFGGFRIFFEGMTLGTRASEALRGSGLAG